MLNRLFIAFESVDHLIFVLDIFLQCGHFQLHRIWNAYVALVLPFRCGVRVSYQKLVKFALLFFEFFPGLFVIIAACFGFGSLIVFLDSFG